MFRDNTCPFNDRLLKGTYTHNVCHRRSVNIYEYLLIIREKFLELAKLDRFLQQAAGCCSATKVINYPRISLKNCEEMYFILRIAMNHLKESSQARVVQESHKIPNNSHGGNYNLSGWNTIRQISLEKF